MSHDFMWYAVLNVGHVRRMARAEIPDWVTSATRPLLHRDGLFVRPIPAVDADLIVARVDESLTLRVRRDARDIAVMGVSLCPTAAINSWRDLHRSGIGAYRTDPRVPPAVPWCGLAFVDSGEPGTGRHLLWVNRFCKAVAWSWVDMHPVGHA